MPTIMLFNIEQNSGHDSRAIESRENGISLMEWCVRALSQVSGPSSVGQYQKQGCARKGDSVPSFPLPGELKLSGDFAHRPKIN